jgi:hypothetical protein
LRGKDRVQRCNNPSDLARTSVHPADLGPQHPVRLYVGASASDRSWPRMLPEPPVRTCREIEAMMHGVACRCIRLRVDASRCTHAHTSARKGSPPCGELPFCNLRGRESGVHFDHPFPDGQRHRRGAPLVPRSGARSIALCNAAIPNLLKSSVTGIKLRHRSA